MSQTKAQLLEGKAANIEFSAGTAALPAITFTGDVNTGIYSPAADTIAFAEGGAEAMRINSSGRVGIGTTSPSNNLTVAQPGTGVTATTEIFSGTVGNASTANISRVLFSTVGGGGGAGTATLSHLVSSSQFVLRSETAGGYEWYVGGSERARIDGSGRLLVGTSTSVSTADASSMQQIIANASNNLTLHMNLGAFGYGGTLNIGRSRNTSYGSFTKVESGDNLGSIRFYGDDGTDYNTVGAEITATVDAATGSNDLPTRLVFSTTADGASSPTERMRIASTGLIATLSGSGADSFYSNTVEGAGTTYNLFRGGHSATSTISSTASIRIYTNGNVQNTNNSYGSLSDIKLKENIVDAGSQWGDFKALQVRNYNLKEGQTHRQIGLIAQEVEPISPGLVYESPDRDEDGNDLGTVTKSVNYSVLYMKAVKALQEAMERIETLEAKVAALEGV